MELQQVATGVLGGAPFCFEDCGEGEQGYAELGAEFLDYGAKRVDDV